MSARQHLPVALLAMLVLPTFTSAQEGEVHGSSAMQALADQYALFRLEADLSHLSENDRQVVRLLIEAVQPMDGVFWQQAYGDEEAALALADGDEATRRFIEINYGPWDRLRGDGPFVDGVGDKPEGANFYPADMTAEEFEAAAADNEPNVDPVVGRACRAGVA
ncbi:MAG: Zn-dependent hydrolase, partial [Gemmatimonadetes bacterium]|nr:Zn-dependent hydrolase [Gemmatimonadota bacterium]